MQKDKCEVQCILYIAVKEVSMWYTKVWEDMVEVSQSTNNIDGEMLEFTLGSKGQCISRAKTWAYKLGLELIDNPRCDADKFVWLYI